MSLLVCAEDCSLADFARQHQLQPRALWLPLQAALPRRASASATVEVDRHTPMALLETATNTLLLDKRVICVRLQVANALTCEEATVTVDPRAVPPGCEVYLRWGRPGAKKLQANTRVLYLEAPAALSTSSRGSIAGVKRGAADDDDGDDEGGSAAAASSSLAQSLRGRQGRRTLAQQSAEDLQRRLAAAVAARGAPPHRHSAHILESTLASMCHRLAQPPLHFVLPHGATSLDAAGVSWARTSRRVLSRVFRAATSEERSEASKYSDGTQQVRFYFVEDVLLRRRREWVVAEQSDSAPPEVELLLGGGLLADMNAFAERGYRIVFLEHYPALHHGSRHAVEHILGPLVRLCRERCPHLTVTVLLSAMSCVTAARRQGMELSLVLPQLGLLSVFISDLNAALSPDPRTSAVVGSTDRGSPFLSGLHAAFARNASLTFVDVKELRGDP
ncbi:hypothetical protein NESM_000547800 [Novymonas esmeraldas]|uniref:Uncharacterized protein n=1 Tax=Novymonas esmeraldas TaxID=1808958 RepID=A0AAW0ERX5_9TRYP